MQRKHDKYDAGQLTRLYRAGELTTIRIPSEAEERVRDVVRCRETLQREVVKPRLYILKFLARRGYIYRAGVHWRPAHYTWLRHRIAIRHPVAAPMIQNDEQLERLPAQWMERMGHGDYWRRILFTTCSQLLLPTPWRRVSSRHWSSSC